MKPTDQRPQGAALPQLPDEPTLAAQLLLVTAAILGMNPVRTLTQVGLDQAFDHAVDSVTGRLPAPVAEETAFQARAKLPTMQAGAEHHEYAAALRLIAGTL